MPTLKYAQIEYERRFLFNQLPADLPLDQFTIIYDTYIPDTRLRLRQMLLPSGALVDLKLTQKYSDPDLPATQTIITNFYLNEVEFEKLSQLTGRSLTKHRHTYHHAGYRWSLDVFQGPLHGLILAEIEALSAEALNKIPVPAFAIKEVTDDPRFTGGSLIHATAESVVALLAHL